VPTKPGLVSALAALTTSFLIGCASQKFTPITNVPAGKSVIYVYRKAEFPGLAPSQYITGNEKRITSLGSGSYFPFLAPAGTNKFGSSPMHPHPWFPHMTEYPWLLSLNSEPGQAYYVQYHFVGGVYFELKDEQTGAREIQNCTLAKPVE
jgi:hypothetical protein